MEKKKFGQSIVQTTSREHTERVLGQLHGSDNPGPLVKSLAPLDFLSTWRMADDEQRADLLIIADKQQVEVLIDLTCWPGDRPDLGELAEIIRPAVESGIGGATRVLHTLNEELRTLTLRQHARVHLLEDRNEQLQVPETSELISCPDGYYFIEFPSPELVTEVDRALFRALLLRPFEEYQRELESMRHEFPSQLEEAAYKWRTSRLADFGFAAREEAMAILTPRTPEEVRSQADKAESSILPLADDLVLPILYGENLQGIEFVDRVLDMLLRDESPESARRADTLGVELTAIANRFLTARGIDIGDPDAVARGITEVRNLFALGLYTVSRGALHYAVHLIQRVEFARMLQVGLGCILPLRNRALKVLRQPDLRSEGATGQVFDPPHFTALHCLSNEVPGYWPPLLDQANGTAISPELFVPRNEDIRTFAEEQEITRFRVFLEEAEALGSLLFEKLGYTPPLPAETPASVLLLTCLGNILAGRTPGGHPISVEAATACHKEYFRDDKKQFVVQTMQALAPVINLRATGHTNPTEEADTTRRLVLRLLHIGHARLKTGMLEQSFVII